MVAEEQHSTFIPAHAFENPDRCRQVGATISIKQKVARLGLGQHFVNDKGLPEAKTGAPGSGQSVAVKQKKLVVSEVVGRKGMNYVNAIFQGGGSKPILGMSKFVVGVTDQVDSQNQCSWIIPIRKG
jgi:hypothetical protein